MFEILSALQQTFLVQVALSPCLPNPQRGSRSLAPPAPTGGSCEESEVSDVP